jgi:hypothetical protein
LSNDFGPSFIQIDLDWIIILFVIYLDAFSEEKIGGISLQGHFSGESQFGKLVSKTFWAILRHQTTIFGVKTFLT